MPHFLNKSQKQHTTEEANETRLVTKVRWVVESANGRIKKWKVISNTMPNRQIPYVGDYLRMYALCVMHLDLLWQRAEIQIKALADVRWL